MPFSLSCRYKIIAFNITDKIEATGSNCLKILKIANLHQFEIGKTKVFLKHYHTELLVRKLDEIGWKIVHVQKQVRSYLAKKIFRWLVVKAKAEQKELRAFCKNVTNISITKYAEIEQHRQQDSLRYHEKVDGAISFFFRFFFFEVFFRRVKKKCFIVIY